MNKVTSTFSGSKTRQQISSEYEWSVQTLRAKLKKLGIILPSGLVSPIWQKLIYETLGYPPGVLSSDYREV